MGAPLKGPATVEERAKYVADEFHRRLDAGDRDLLEVVVRKQLQIAVDQATKDHVDEDELEKQKDSAYKLGEHSGLGEAAGIMLTKATAAFEADKDEEAKLLREIHKELKKKSDERHPRFGKKLNEP